MGFCATVARPGPVIICCMLLIGGSGIGTAASQDSPWLTNFTLINKVDGMEGPQCTASLPLSYAADGTNSYTERMDCLSSESVSGPSISDPMGSSVSTTDILIGLVSTRSIPASIHCSRRTSSARFETAMTKHSFLGKSSRICLAT